MCTKTLILTLAVCLALAGAAAGQTKIVDAHGKLVGAYVYGNSLTTGELAIRQVGNQWIGLPVSPTKGFLNTGLPGFPSSSRGNLSTVQIGPKANTGVYWSGPNCNGTPYISGYANAIALPEPGSFLPPFVSPALIANGSAYYLATAEYPDIAIQSEITVCSLEGADGGCLAAVPPTGCMGMEGIAPANTLELSTLHLTPPFSLR
jgi:hypothetical protein